MTHTNRISVHASADRSDRRSSHPAHPSSHRLSTRIIDDAVVAGYIHDISQRHRDGGRAFENRVRRAGQFSKMQ